MVSAQHIRAGHSPFALAGGATVMVGATAAAAALFPASQDQAGLLVIALAAGGCAAVLADTRISLAVAGLGYLLFTGFLVSTRGELAWDGMSSLWHLLTLSVATALGLGQRWIQAVQADLAIDDELQDLLDQAEPGENDNSRR